MTPTEKLRTRIAGRCAIGPPVDTPHQIDGDDLNLCKFHKQQRHRWERALDRYVQRAAQKASHDGRPFDRDREMRQREADNPFDPQARGDSQQGPSLSRADAQRLRASTDALLRAKVALDDAHLGAQPLADTNRRALLAAIQSHARLVDRLLKPPRARRR